MRQDSSRDSYLTRREPAKTVHDRMWQMAEARVYRGRSFMVKREKG